MNKYVYLLIFIFSFSTKSSAQQPKKPNASEIFESIKKLNFLGSVLYLAAHPDDENTRLISYLSNHVKARTAYLSLTRGDGGQNLIGPEIRELLGVIRTQELLAARRTDGGEQRFTRANDFGYSKHPDETLAIWNKDEVLKDVILAIRQFKPDIIINRFNHKTPGTTHGHHTSSAMLSFEAFDLAGNPDIYPNQAKKYGTWQPRREFFNTSWWFYGSRENFEKADKTNLLNFDTGTYYPSSGLSNTEIASLSRSQHKSQGFGNTGTRGSQIEYIELIKGDLPKNKDNIFDGINTTWSRVQGGKAIGEILTSVEANFDFKNPSASVPNLVKAYNLVQQLENKHWKDQKTKELKAVIYACSGLYLEAVSNTNYASKDETIEVNFEAINRSIHTINLIEVKSNHSPSLVKNKKLEPNERFNFKSDFNVSNGQKPTTPYWLNEAGSLGMYKVANPSLVGLAETPRVFNYDFILDFNGTTISFKKPLVYKTNDPVKGEVYKPFEIIPKASVALNEKVFIFSTKESKTVSVTVKSGTNNLKGVLSLNSPRTWKVSPKSIKVAIANKGESQSYSFTLQPLSNQTEGFVTPELNINGDVFNKELIEINYDHIPQQTILLAAKSKVVKLDIKKYGEHVAYIEGAGDIVPQSLEQIGYKVTTLTPEEITSSNLANFDAVVIGIRAYNTVKALKFKQNTLFDFVKNGGNMIVQYNTSHRLKVDELAPYHLKLSRDRVTDENAKVSFLSPKHEVLNTPNKITMKDFEGWTQERGLYFPNEWADEFTPILAMNDKGETVKEGSLLVSKYGKGYYIYTGLSFFREFPAGVSGAYRLFANLISIGQLEQN